MKKLKIVFAFVSFFIFLSCSTIVDGNSDLHPDFKIGKKEFENSLKKEFDFEKLSIGTYFTKKNGISEEKGLNLTFEINNLRFVTDSLITIYSDKITVQVKKYLLNKDNYDYVIIKFEEETKGEISRSTSLELKKQL